MFQTLGTILTAVRYLPTILELVRKAKAAFTSEGMQEFFAAIVRLVDRSIYGLWELPRQAKQIHSQQIVWARQWRNIASNSLCQPRKTRR